MSSRNDFAKLQDLIYAQRSLDDASVHGLDHWNQVEFNGIFLAARTHADVEVVRLFALFHDSRRETDFHDPQHGARGAELAKAWLGKHFTLEKDRFELLYIACRDHTNVPFSGDPTIDTCFDADRLDLGRVGIYPDPRKMATEFGKKIARRAREEGIPVFQFRKWIRNLKW